MTDVDQYVTEQLPLGAWRSLAVFALTLSLMMLATGAWTINRGGDLDAPPAPWNVDGVFYDNIAVQLNQDAEFSVDFNRPQWRSDYQDANTKPLHDQQYNWVLQYRGTGPTTMRSPGYPLALAGVYRLFGHRFDAARIFGCLLVSLAMSMLATWIAQRWGVVACAIFCGTVILDYSVMQAAGTIASESLAIFLLTCVFLAAVGAVGAAVGTVHAAGGEVGPVQKPSLLRWFLCGGLFAALLLTRGNWNLGLLIFLALSVLILIPAIRKRIPSVEFRYVVTFFATVMVIAMPWWIRNCSLTGKFAPFGSAGPCGLAAAWCDDSLEDHGHWQPQVFNNMQRQVVDDMKGSGDQLVPREVEMARRSSQTAIAWCKSNWIDIPELMFWRSLSHWGFFNPSVPATFHWLNVAMVAAGFIGCLFLTGRLRGLFTIVLLVDLAIVMLTWAHLGRYAIPIRPLIHLGLALTICRFWYAVLKNTKLAD